MRHRPPRLAGHKPQPLLQRQVVHLVDHAVDVIRQFGATLADACVVVCQRRRTVDQLDQVTYRKAPAGQLQQHGVVRVEQALCRCSGCQITHTISKKAQGPARRNRRVELAHRTGCGVTRVDEGLVGLAASGDALQLRRIQLIEIVAPHVHLAAHFKHGRCVCRQAQRNLPNGPDVACDVFPVFAVTAGGGLHK